MNIRTVHSTGQRGGHSDAVGVAVGGLVTGTLIGFFWDPPAAMLALGAALLIVRRSRPMEESGRRTGRSASPATGWRRRLSPSRVLRRCA